MADQLDRAAARARYEEFWALTRTGLSRKEAATIAVELVHRIPAALDALDDAEYAVRNMLELMAEFEAKYPAEFAAIRMDRLIAFAKLTPFNPENLKCFTKDPS